MPRLRRMLTAAAVLVVAAGLPASAAPGEITTVAGGGLGDGGPARESWIEGVEGLALAPDGAVLVVDQLAHRVRRIDPGADGIVTGGGDDVITTIAGNGESAPAAWSDGAVATEVAIPRPESVAALADGAILIGAENRILRLDTGGHLWTFAGDRSGPGRGDGGPALGASFNSVTSLLVDGDRLYVGEYRAVRMIDLSTGTISTVVGRHDCGHLPDPGDDGPGLGACFAYAQGLALDGAGNLLVTDEFHESVRRVTPGPDGVVNGGPGEQITRVLGGVRYPQDLAFDPAGRLVVGSDQRVLRIDPGPDGLVDGSGDEVTVVMGDGSRNGTARDGHPAIEADARYVPGVLIDGHGRLLVGESSQVSHVSHIDDDGVLRYVAGLGRPIDGETATSVRFAAIDDIVDDRGDSYVLDGDAGIVRRIDGTTGLISRVVGGGSLPPTTAHAGIHPREIGLPVASAMDVGPDGSLWIVTTRALHRVTPGVDGRVDGSPDERIVTVSVAATAAPHADAPPASLAGWAVLRLVSVGASGDVYVASSRAVYRLGPAGVLVTVAGTGQLGSSGDCTTPPCPPARLATFDWISSIALGGGGHLFVADGGRSRIRMVTPGADGVVGGDDDEHVRTVVGSCTDAWQTCDERGATGHPANAHLTSLAGIDVDQDGRLSLVDSSRNTVHVVDPGADGVVDGSDDERISVLAGVSGRAGFAGDGGSGTQALLAGPEDVTVSADGVLVLDTWNRRIRLVER